jgi:hypothetical protein
MSTPVPSPLDPATFSAPSLEDPAVVIKGHGDTTEQAVLMEFQDCYGNTLNRFLGDGTLEHGGGNGGGGTIDPAVWQAKSEKDAPSGYVGLDASSRSSFAGGISVGGSVFMDDTGQIMWGPGDGDWNGWDVNLYRDPAGWILRTDSVFQSSSDIKVGNYLYFATGSGETLWDTSLYRSAANSLKTDGAFTVGGQLGSVLDVIARTGDPKQTYIGSVFGNPGVSFGPASDTNLYRAAAGVLKTDGGLSIGSVGATGATGPFVTLQVVTTVPTTNPTGGVILYVDGNGNLVCRTAAGNVRVVAAV